MENQGSPSTTSTNSAAPMSSAPKVFASSIADKLNEENFLPRRHEALASIKGQKLQKHVEKSRVPERYSSEEDREAEKETGEYANWEQQDHYLVSWLLSSMDSSFKNRMVGSDFPHEIQRKIEKYFASQTRSKIKQLKTQLKGMKKQGMEASEYLLKIKKSVDALAAVGAPLSTAEHILHFYHVMHCLSLIFLSRVVFPY